MTFLSLVMRSAWGSTCKVSIFSGNKISLTFCSSIKRVIFQTTMKSNGATIQPMEHSNIKQIAGRAGRYRTASNFSTQSSGERRTTSAVKEETLLDLEQAPNVGLVTSLGKGDQRRIHEAMASTPKPFLSAGIIPPDNLILRFSSYFPPRTPLSYILLRLQEVCRMNPRFHLCSNRDQLQIADTIQSVNGLTMSDRLIFCAAPAPMRDPHIPIVLVAYAKCVSQQSNGALLDIEELPLEIIENPKRDRPSYLGELESLHRALVLYLWLSYRFSGVFTSQAMAIHVKRLVEKEIEETLSQLKYRAVGKYKPGQAEINKMLQSLADKQQSFENERQNEASVENKEPVSIFDRPPPPPGLPPSHETTV